MRVLAHLVLVACLAFVQVHGKGMEYQGKDAKNLLDKVAGAIKEHQKYADYTDEMRRAAAPTEEEKLASLKARHQRMSDYMKEKQEEEKENKKKNERKGLQDKVEQLKKKHEKGIKRLKGDKAQEEL
eukprot:TRINITY_DN33793_c0_g1_i1.p1 TRINITY_DN33793_c0_g1~~TRINITY_DN33793_c0_g1_i1.p1  ORF type:complete len:144 (+),score=48.48 TRINITY_DN33793_c0_g1_i1:53-433(+)